MRWRVLIQALPRMRSVVPALVSSTLSFVCVSCRNLGCNLLRAMSIYLQAGRLAVSPTTMSRRRIRESFPAALPGAGRVVFTVMTGENAKSPLICIMRAVFGGDYSGANRK